MHPDSSYGAYFFVLPRLALGSADVLLLLLRLDVLPEDLRPRDDASEELEAVRERGRPRLADLREGARSEDEA